MITWRAIKRKGAQTPKKPVRKSSCLEDLSTYLLVALVDFYFLSVVAVLIFVIILSFTSANYQATIDTYKLALSIELGAAITICFDTIYLNYLRGEPEYVELLANLAANGRGTKVPLIGNILKRVEVFQFQDSRRFYIGHFKAIRRGIRRKSFGNFNILLSLGLRRRYIEDAENLRFRDIKRALNYQMIDKVSKLPKERWREPFVNYAKTYRDTFANEKPSSRTWIKYLLDRYSQIPDEIIHVEKTKRHRRYISKIEENVHLWTLLFLPLIVYVMQMIINIILGIKTP